MCGIAGIVRWDGAPVAEHEIRAMCGAMVHRGPDDEGVYLGDGVGARHAPAQHHRPRRRAPADLQRGRHRSGSSSTARSTTTASCAASSSARGHVFRTDSDTETIVHLYEEHGAALRRAAARHVRVRDLGHARQRQLLLARDRLGIKPLYYAERDGELLFASELKPILQLPRVDRSRQLAGASATCSRSSPRRRRPEHRRRRRRSSSRRASPIAARRPAAAHRALLGRRSSSPNETATEGELVEQLRALLDESVDAAPGQRRAGRRVPQRRHRLERRRRDDGAACGRPAQDLLDRLRRSRLRRARPRARRSRRSSAPITTTWCCGPTWSRSSRT